ncbi:MAG: TonB-dependent receptor plug domain-containing protein [Pseudomonadota bacterium]
MFTRPHLVFGTLVTLLSAIPAVAQQSQDDDAVATPIDLIVVTGDAGYRATNASSATGLNVPLEELPLNIQVITEDLIEDFQLLSQRDALQFHAAVDDKRVRGFNTGEFFRNGFVHLSDAPGFTIQRLEIIRGANAVLNGPVTPGGAVNIITKQPRPDETFGEVSGYFGIGDNNRENRGGHFDFNAGSLGGTIDGAFRFVGGWQGDTGYGTPVDNQMSALLPMLEVRPGDSTVVNVEYYQYKINSDRTDRPMAVELTVPGPTPGEEIPLAIAYGLDPYSSYFGESTDIEESLADYTVKVAHEFGDTLLGQFQYNNHSRDFVFGPGNRPRIDIFYRLVTAPGAPADTTNPDDFLLRRLTEDLSLTNDIDQISASLAWLPDFGAGTNHQIVVGLDSYDQDAHLTIQRPRESGETSGFFFEFFDPSLGAAPSFNAGGADVFFTTVLDRTDEVEQSNLFVNYHGGFVDERLHLLLGLYRSDIEITRTNLRASPVIGETIADNDELLLQAGFVFDVNEQFGVYANYSESQLPDLNDPDFNTSPPVRLGEQREIGVKLSLLDGRLDASFAYFEIDEELIGETQREAEASGFEVDATWVPVDNLSVSFSYANAETEITSSSNPDVVGDPLVDEISDKAALWSRYDFGGGALDGLALGASLVWTGDRVRPTAGAAQAVKKLNGNVLFYEPETRLDLFATYDLGNYEVSLNLRNLTEDVNLSNTVPRVPLQGGVQPNGEPYTFDGSMEIMLGLRAEF